MSVYDTLTTERLVINDLSLTDAPFILDLVNSPGWLQFIGARNVKSVADGEDYIRKIHSNPEVTYRVVRVKEGLEPIGVVTLIRRHYLDDDDIGFAFLPQHTGKGYAYEATMALMNVLKREDGETILLAITVKENNSSISLLKKCGFGYAQEINVDGELLELYSVQI